MHKKNISRLIIEDMESVPEICGKHKKAMFWRGDWFCSDCLQEEEWQSQESEAIYYSKMRLCLECDNHGDNYCSKYPKMPETMFGRKKKCKHYKEYIPEPYFEDYGLEEYEDFKRGTL